MKKINNLIFLFTSILFLFASCDKTSSVLKSGIWRGALITESGAEIPFNFEVADSAGKNYLDIFNSTERFRVNEISKNGDSILIQMPLFDSEIKGVLTDGKITGVWTKHLADTDVVMQFFAEAGIDWRIKKEFEKPAEQVTGKWATTFISADGQDTTIAIGEFVQNDAKVTGTFLTSTGDYRYLDGILDGNKLMISTFDGSHAYLFTATLNGDKLIDGKFYSDFSYLETWSAVKDDQAKLPDAYGLTVLKTGEKKINFSFPNLDQKMISLNDAQFKNKVVVMQMLGSWCPNCMDETAYLSKFYDKYKPKGVEVVGLAYERTRDFDKSKKNIERLKNRFNVKYNLLVTGFTKDKEDAAKSLPMLNKVIAFPTMIIIDKKGEVREIHTGFSGPGTGNHYTEFVNEFEKLINDLLKES
jgi:thiol-disulfide isomerase/thioredoxin